MNGTIFFRADHELIGRVLAEKLRRRMERSDFQDCVRIVPSRPLATSDAAPGFGERPPFGR
ncbi:hypothetical protein [Sphingomonas sp. PAMC 26617]|uniref:hypothetical protein n=1 Tax=Sphingomonas sp. PAMC 26617 TaxID=1112216 RepID=UPI0002883140|nr:hypothetical protein [Sphingomonas sp. PAMC 26617]